MKVPWNNSGVSNPKNSLALRSLVEGALVSECQNPENSPSCSWSVSSFVALTLKERKQDTSHMQAVQDKAVRRALGGTHTQKYSLPMWGSREFQGSK